MKALWDKISAYRPIPACTCPHPCKCEAMRSTKITFLKIKSFNFLLA